MAAIYTYDTTGGELFRAGINVLSSIRLPFLDSLLYGAPGAGSTLTIITELSVQNSETIQFFLTFDDLVSWFYFGKGMGTMSIRGLMLTNDSGTPGLPALLSSSMSRLRGRSVGASIGNAVFTCVMTNFSLHMTQDPSPVVDFTINLSIVDHSLPVERPVNSACAYNPANTPIDFSRIDDLPFTA